MTKKRRNIDPYLEEEIFSFENNSLCVKISDTKRICFVDDFDIEEYKKIKDEINKCVMVKKSERILNKLTIKK